MSTAAPTFSSDEILWYDNGRWGESGYAIANPAGKTWTNNAMLEYEKPIWAVAVPVVVRFEGDAVCGRPVTGYAFAGDEAASHSLDPHTVYDS